MLGRKPLLSHIIHQGSNLLRACIAIITAPIHTSPCSFLALVTLAAVGHNAGHHPTRRSICAGTVLSDRYEGGLNRHTARSAGWSLRRRERASSERMDGMGRDGMGRRSLLRRRKRNITRLPPSSQGVRWVWLLPHATGQPGLFPCVPMSGLEGGGVGWHALSCKTLNLEKTDGRSVCLRARLNRHASFATFYLKKPASSPCSLSYITWSTSAVSPTNGQTRMPQLYCTSFPAARTTPARSMSADSSLDGRRRRG